jgi:NADH:ubiquinone oxidoreductase subunit K
MVLMSIELILNSVNINLVAFGAYTGDIGGQVFALFVIAVAAAEVGVGLAIVLLIYRNRRSIDVSQANLLRDEVDLKGGRVDPGPRADVAEADLLEG